MAQTISKGEPKIDIDYETISPRFSVENIEELQQGIEYLNEYGYAVFSNILMSDEINHSIDLFWKHLECLKSVRIRRDDPGTWDKDWPGIHHIGLLNDYGMGQSEFMWYIRGKASVKKVFSHIWNSNELLISFDGAGCFRDWHVNQEWKTNSGWYHCDQNPFRKPFRCSVQGLVALTDNDESTGGLVVVPDSHNKFIDLQFVVDENRLWGDYVSIPTEMMKVLRPRLIKCKAGDLIVWDSRCFHCNTPAVKNIQKTSSLPEAKILRLVAYVCMSPLSMFEADEVRCESLEEFREIREELVRDRVTCTHWPLEINTASRTSKIDILPLKLTKYERSLIVGAHVEPDDRTDEIVF